MNKTITDYYTGREFRNVEIISEDDCPSGQPIAWVTDSETFIHYAIYEDPVSFMLYAVPEDAE